MTLHDRPRGRASDFSGLFAAAFVIMIATPLVIHCWQGSAAVLRDEKRNAAAFPSLPGKDRPVRTFVRELDAYLKDNYGLRNWLLSSYNVVKYRVFGNYDTGSGRALFGKNRWMYYTQFEQIDAYRGRYVVPESHLKEVADGLKRQYDAVTSRGMTYAAVIAPNKQSIYPENLPDWAQRSLGSSATDQILAYVKQQYPEIIVIDTRDGVRNAKHLAPLFVPTDIHWTMQAGYFANAEIITSLQKANVNIPDPSPWSEYAVTPQQDVGGDLSALISLRAHLKETIYAVTKSGGFRSRRDPTSPYMQFPTLDSFHPTFVYKIDDDRLPRVLVFRNSFFTSLMPFFSEHFRETIILWRDFDTAYIDKVHPDIVVRQFFEMELFQPSPETLKQFVERPRSSESR
ncbi:MULTISPECIES: alginate O-acetyltransferase AlgX-related protein [unclassified Bradyrhizobium]|uniref:alginate O-acetyltransferase AlgX-related protein n=1 Tax=unclassified Bradyrhizobium TaxID=2631580 RepID=UPI002FF2A24C